MYWKYVSGWWVGLSDRQFLIDREYGSEESAAKYSAKKMKHMYEELEWDEYE